VPQGHKAKSVSKLLIGDSPLRIACNNRLLKNIWPWCKQEGSRPPACKIQGIDSFKYIKHGTKEPVKLQERIVKLVVSGGEYRTVAYPNPIDIHVPRPTRTFYENGRRVTKKIPYEKWDPYTQYLLMIRAGWSSKDAWNYVADRNLVRSGIDIDQLILQDKTGLKPLIGYIEPEYASFKVELPIMVHGYVRERPDMKECELLGIEYDKRHTNEVTGQVAFNIKSWHIFKLLHWILGVKHEDMTMACLDEKFDFQKFWSDYAAKHARILLDLEPGRVYPDWIHLVLYRSRRYSPPDWRTIDVFSKLGGETDTKMPDKAYSEADTKKILDRALDELNIPPKKRFFHASTKACIESGREHGGINNFIEDIFRTIPVQLNYGEDYLKICAEENETAYMEVLKWSVQTFSLMKTYPIFVVDIPESGGKHRVPGFTCGVVAVIARYIGQFGLRLLAASFPSEFRGKVLKLPKGDMYESTDMKGGSTRLTFDVSRGIWKWIMEKNGITKYHSVIDKLFSPYVIIKDTKWLKNIRSLFNDKTRLQKGVKLIFQKMSMTKFIPGKFATAIDQQAYAELMSENLPEHITAVRGPAQGLGITAVTVWLSNFMPHYMMELAVSSSKIKGRSFILNHTKVGDDSALIIKLDDIERKSKLNILSKEDLAAIRNLADEKNKALRKTGFIPHEDEKRFFSTRGLIVRERAYVESKYSQYLTMVPEMDLRGFFSPKSGFFNVNAWLTVPTELKKVISAASLVSEGVAERLTYYVYWKFKKYYDKLDEMGINVFQGPYRLFEERYNLFYKKRTEVLKSYGDRKGHILDMVPDLLCLPSENYVPIETASDNLEKYDLGERGTPWIKDDMSYEVDQRMTVESALAITMKHMSRPFSAQDRVPESKPLTFMDISQRIIQFLESKPKRERTYTYANMAEERYFAFGELYGPTPERTLTVEDVLQDKDIRVVDWQNWTQCKLNPEEARIAIKKFKEYVVVFYGNLPGVERYGKVGEQHWIICWPQKPNADKDIIKMCNWLGKYRKTSRIHVTTDDKELIYRLNMVPLVVTKTVDQPRQKQAEKPVYADLNDMDFSEKLIERFDLKGKITFSEGPKKRTENIKSIPWETIDVRAYRGIRIILVKNASKMNPKFEKDLMKGIIPDYLHKTAPKEKKVKVAIAPYTGPSPLSPTPEEQYLREFARTEREVMEQALKVELPSSDEDGL